MNDDLPIKEWLDKEYEKYLDDLKNEKLTKEMEELKNHGHKTSSEMGSTQEIPS